MEQFYDLLKLNSEAREYDFKKNLEAKTKLCEAAEKLADEEDVLSAFRKLQDLHIEYRETGPVAKELREEIWARFKAASTVINIYKEVPAPSDRTGECQRPGGISHRLAFGTCHRAREPAAVPGDVA